MDDEAPPNGGLDARGGQRRPRWGRRTPYGIRRDSRGDGWHEPADGRSDATYAALDLGTNNCRLLIARPDGKDGFRIVDSFSRIVRLGEGVATTGMISGAAMERTIAALKICADHIRKSGASHVRAIATQAARLAGNADVLIARARDEAGIALSVVQSELVNFAGVAPIIVHDAAIYNRETELKWSRTRVADRLESLGCVLEV